MNPPRYNSHQCVFCNGIVDYSVEILALRNPIRHGCGLAFNSRSNRSQNSPGSTVASINSCMSVQTFCATGFGSRLDSSNKFARNFRHFSLVLCRLAYKEQCDIQLMFVEKEKETVVLFM